jgi:two-component system, NtrC family, response regulator HydG
MPRPAATGADRTRRRRPRETAAPAIATSDHHLFPDVQDLVRTLRFRPDEGRLWFDDQRSLIVRAAMFGNLRRELLSLVGAEKARSLLVRTGYAEGVRDADLARRLRPEGDFFESFAVGPQIHALSGFARVETRVMRADPERGLVFGDFLLHDSVEAETHVAGMGPSAEPVCWLSLGYASGYFSAFIGRPVLLQETQCSAMGHSACRFVGRPAEDWQPSRARPGRHYFPPGDLVHRLAPPAQAATTRGGRTEVVGISAGFNIAMHLLRRAAPTTVTVLCLGETGVGKEVFARLLHQMSPRAGKPFVAVNCAALPESLIEAELFGVVKGAYTGASGSRPGRFERADGGTLFLDEIGTLNLASQGKLLRALQEREIERVGDSATREVDVRVVAATNADLKEAVKAGRFRDDLYFRLTTFPVRIPPLRERRDDIPLLMRHFLDRFCTAHGRRVSGFTARAVEALLAYPFPGNIRELENMVERGVLLAGDDEPMDVGHLFLPSEQPGVSTFVLGGERLVAGTTQDGPDAAPRWSAPDSGVDEALRALRGRPLREVADGLLALTLEECGGNRAEAARRLGLTRRQVDYRLGTTARRAARRTGQRAGQSPRGT